MHRPQKFLAAAALGALAIASCQKEKLLDASQGDDLVTFTVNTAPGTKAGSTVANVDEVFVAVYLVDGDTYSLYDTQSSVGENAKVSISSSEGAFEKATFSINLIRNQKYQIVVWADKKSVYDVKADLSEIKRAQVYENVCNSDELDAFYASVSFTQGSDDKKTITATRPFGQLNLITTDLRKGFDPGKVTLAYKTYTQFNALTGVASELQPVSYSAEKPYYYKNEDSKVAGSGNYTLAMNYVFTTVNEANNPEKLTLGDVVLTADAPQTVSLTVNNIPIQRNYRTNVIGALLTDPEDFTVEVSAKWADDDVNVDTEGKIIVENIAAANEALAAGVTDIALESIADSGDSETPTTLYLPAISQEVSIKLPADNTASLTISYADENASSKVSTLNITAENNTGALTIKAQNTHVVLNGKYYDHVDAYTSLTTLVVEEGVTIDELNVYQGGLEIHGTVNSLTINPVTDKYGKYTVLVGKSEGLGVELKDVVSDYIQLGYEIVENDGAYDIDPIFVGGDGYKTNPFLIRNEEQFMAIPGVTKRKAIIDGGVPSSVLYYKLVSDIAPNPSEKVANKSYGAAYALLDTLDYRVDIDGYKSDTENYKLTLPYMTSLANQANGILINNLDVVVNGFPMLVYGYGGFTFTNVNLSGYIDASGFSESLILGAYVIKASSPKFINCTSYVDFKGKGGAEDYNAIFLGSASNAYLTFTNCVNKGRFVSGKSSMFVANPEYSKPSLTISGCTNEGEIYSTYVGDDYNFNYYFSKEIYHSTFTINKTQIGNTQSTTYTSDVPNVLDDNSAFGVVNSGVVKNGAAE